MIIAVSIGQLVFAMERQIRGWRFIDMAVVGGEDIGMARKGDIVMVRSSELSERERQVIDLVCEGLSNDQIAGALGISADTAKFHIANICDKLEAMNRTHAAVLWTRRQLSRSSKSSTSIGVTSSVSSHSI